MQKRANIDRKAFSKLKCGTTRNPSKPTALALAIALELNLDDTKDLLSRAGLALSPCSRQSVIIRILSTYRAAFNRDGQSKHHQCGCSFIYEHLNIKPL